MGVARATLGEAWAQARAKLKKTELATVMEEAFAGGDAAAAGVPAESREPARFWVMPGFQAYDNRGLDDDGGDKEGGVAGDGGADGNTEDAAADGRRRTMVGIANRPRRSRPIRGTPRCGPYPSSRASILRLSPSALPHPAPPRSMP